MNFTRVSGFAAALLLSVSIGAAAGLPADEVAALVADGRLPAAASAACNWAAEEPGNLDALQLCGALALEVGRYHEAEDALRSLLFYTPNDPHLLVMLGRALLGRGLLEEAREKFETAIYLGAAPENAYVDLARLALLDSEDPGEMLSAAEVALSLAPDYAPAHTVMGAVLRTLGHHEPALETLLRAREMDPGHAPTLFELGLAWTQLGNEEPAHRAWHRFTTMAPFSGQTWLLRNHLVIVGIEEILDRAFDATYSPDGTRIAFYGRGLGGWGIYTIPAVGSPVETRLWSSEDNIQSFAWSPDASSIAVTTAGRRLDGDGTVQLTRRLILVPTDGGEARELIEDRQFGEVTWHPGGGQIGVRHHERGDGWRILKVDPETGAQTPVLVSDRRRPHHYPAWSSDGSKLLAIRRGDQLSDGSFEYELMVGPADDFANAAVVLRIDALPRGAIFSADGSAILLALPGPVDKHVNIWALPADGSRDPVMVDHMAGPQCVPALSPDGDHLLTTRGTMLVRATLAGLKED